MAVLEESDFAAASGEPVITRYHEANANLRTQLCRIIRKAGLTPWPKLFHNLRSSRQTELAERYPIHVVCAWIGNSRAVAQEHYLQVTDAHFAQAIQDSPKEAAQNQAQSTAVTVGKSEKTPRPENENRPGLPSDSDAFRYLPNDQVGAVGFEPTKA